MPMTPELRRGIDRIRDYLFGGGLRRGIRVSNRVDQQIQLGGGRPAFPPDSVAHLLRTRPCRDTEEPGDEHAKRLHADSGNAARQPDAPARAAPRPVVPGPALRQVALPG